jgi:hypothetical protein
VVHLAEEDRPFATARAVRVVIVENEEFPAFFAGCVSYTPRRVI